MQIRSNYKKKNHKNIHRNHLKMTKTIYKIKTIIQAFSKLLCFIYYNTSISHSFLGVSP